MQRNFTIDVLHTRRERFRSFTSTWCAILMIVIALSASGCGGPPEADYGKLGLVDISGTVTLDGRPLGGATVHFVDTDQTYCIGVTDDAGHYEMMLDSRKSGVVPGEKIVRISSRAAPSEAGAAAEEDPDATPKATEKVPACYNKSSALKIQVTAADSAMDFDLKSDCSTTGFK